MANVVIRYTIYLYNMYGLVSYTHTHTHIILLGDVFICGGFVTVTNGAALAAIHVPNMQSALCVWLSATFRSLAKCAVWTERQRWQSNRQIAMCVCTSESWNRLML